MLEPASAARRCGYTAADLKTWGNQVLQETWREAFVFFKHEEQGTGPKLVHRFVALAAAA